MEQIGGWRETLELSFDNGVSSYDFSIFAGRLLIWWIPVPVYKFRIYSNLAGLKIHRSKGGIKGTIIIEGCTAVSLN